MLHDVAGVGRAAQQPVELGQLATLAFGAHPAVLALVPLTRAMKQEETIGAVPGVQLVDSPPRGLDEHRVIGLGALVSVRKVREQGEMQMRVAIRKEPNLEVVEERDQTRLRIDDRGNRHDRAIGRGDASPHVELRQLTRRDLRCDDEVDQADRELAEGQQNHDGRQPEVARDAAVAMCIGDETRDRERRDGGDRPQVAEDRMTVEKTGESLPERGWTTDVTLEAEASARDQVVADVMRAVLIGR